MCMPLAYGLVPDLPQSGPFTIKIPDWKAETAHFDKKMRRLSRIRTNYTMLRQKWVWKFEDMNHAR